MEWWEYLAELGKAVGKVTVSPVSVFFSKDFGTYNGQPLLNPTPNFIRDITKDTPLGAAFDIADFLNKYGVYLLIGGIALFGYSMLRRK